jgi:cytochrome c-type biogenesis protein CcmH
MALWIVLALMTIAAIFAVVWPLMRADRVVRSGSDIEVYKDQLDEIQRDRAAGLIGETEAEAAQLEVSRRLLAAADAQTAPASSKSTVSTAIRRRFGVAAGLIIALGSAAVYATLGSPSLPGQPLATREKAPSVDSMLAQVEAHLAKNPNDGRGWEVIAPLYLRLGRLEDAVKARRAALALNGENADRLAGLGEALLAAADGKMPAEAITLFRRAVALDGQNVKARYFLGIAAEQDGRPAEAVSQWRAMLADAPPDAPWAEFIRNEIARLAGAPDPAMMVARLAERLKNEGPKSDPAMWRMLIHSLVTLQKPEEAKAAAANARQAYAGLPDKLSQLEELIKDYNLPD